MTFLWYWRIRAWEGVLSPTEVTHCMCCSVCTEHVVLLGLTGLIYLQWFSEFAVLYPLVKMVHAVICESQSEYNLRQFGAVNFVVFFGSVVTHAFTVEGSPEWLWVWGRGNRCLRLRMFKQRNPSYLPEKQPQSVHQRRPNVVCVQWENVELETLQDTGEQQQ